MLALLHEVLCYVNLLLGLILNRYIYQSCGFNVTGQLKEPRDLARPAPIWVIYTVLYSPEFDEIRLGWWLKVDAL